MIVIKLIFGLFVAFVVGVVFFMILPIFILMVKDCSQAWKEVLDDIKSLLSKK